MKISCNKLKQYIKNSDQIDWVRIWDTFSIRSAEVEGVEIKGEDLKNVVIAEITSHEIHPQKEQYHLLKVFDGTETFDVLCGAPNARAGIKVAYVKVGGMVSGFEISEKKIAGVLSQGMCCAVDELGIGSDHDGILELPSDAPVGLDICEYFPEIKDVIVEIDNKSLTNRPDMWGHYGIAREIAAITNNELIPLELIEPKNNLEDLSIDIKVPELCNRFSAITIDNITRKKSPMSMQIFLHYTGMRSISLLVDLSNYLMLELGQPNHTYDASKVENLIVDMAQDNDTFKTLDGVERKLTKDNLMIKNNNEYIGIAGIMGGEDSEIAENTTKVYLEAASFDATSIRKTATALGLRTEASARFEKSLDPNLTITTIKRFIYLLKELDQDIKITSNLTDIYPTKLIEKSVTLSKKKLEIYMAFKMDDKEVETILTNLGFKVTTNEDNYEVTIPSFRSTKDVSIAEDIIEEIARMHGYENMDIEPLKLELNFVEHENIFDQEYEAKRLLATKYNLSEVHTYLWHKTSFLKELEITKENVYLEGKSEDNILRDDLSLSLLEVSGINLKRDHRLGIFEIGTTIVENKNKRILSLLLADDEKKSEDLYYRVKNKVYNLFHELKNINIEFAKSESYEYYNNDMTYTFSYNGEILGNIRVFNNRVSGLVAKKKVFVAAEIDFDKYINLNKKTELFEPISKYPQVTLDYTIIMANEYHYEMLDQILKCFDNEYIKKYTLIDKYNAQDSTKYTIRYIVGSNDKTLTSDDLSAFKESFIKYIKENDLNIIE